MEWNAAVQKVLWYLGNGAVCCKRSSKQPKPEELQKEMQKIKLLMHYVIKISQSRRDEIVDASLFSAHAWKNISLSKNHWVNLRKENDCAWQCYGDDVCQLMNWEATICSSLQSKGMHKLSPKKEIFFFFPSKRNAGTFCSVLHLQFVFFFHKTWWLLRRESLLQVVGRGVTHDYSHHRFPFAFRFVDFDDKPLPLSFSVVSAASPTAQRCFLC